MSIVSFMLRKIEPWYCRWSNWHTRNWFLRNARRYPYAERERGVTIVAGLENPISLSKVMRDLAFRLKAAGIPFQTYSISPRRLVPSEDVEPILTPREDFRAARYSHIIEMNDSVFPAEELGIERLTISFWEFDSGYLEHMQRMLEKRHVVGMSDFTVDYFRRTLPAAVRVSKLLYPFIIPDQVVGNGVACAKIREKYGIPASAFAVFFNFDYGSGYHRKSPYAVVKAFAKAFDAKDSAVLVMKTMQANAHPDRMAELVALATKLGVIDRCIFVDSYLPMSELYVLTNACDVYISLHRGEGFGLGICEAMSMGKPVVVTNYSANTEFCKDDNSILVPCSMVAPLAEQNDVPYYKHVTQWAEPDVSCAAKALRQLYDSPELRQKLGAKAKMFITEHFSVGNFRKSVNELIEVK